MKKEEREEDSGLHDIRNLAQSTKQRLSSRRVSTSPISDEDALASASGSWKNIALPQPAKMVSLPDIAELPSKADLAAAEKAAKDAAAAAKEAEKAAKKAARDSKKEIASAAPAASVTAVEPVAAAPAVSAPVERKAFALPSQQQTKSKGPLFALVGLGVAAAAGGVIYMQMGKKSEEPAPQVAQAPAVAPAKVEVTPIEPAAAPTPPPADTAAAGSAVAEEPVAQIAAPAEPETKADDKKAKAVKKAPKEHTVEIVDEGKKVAEKPVAPDKKAAPAKGSDAAGGEGEPSFDALLKEAGVDESKKEKKPTLDKKMLSGDDFKKGMAAVASKAQACYAGTQGTAMLKLSVSPEGKVSKVTVGGAFAGKPEADCVANAVKAATFPPWDGGPQSFSYSYMLAE